MKPSEAEVEEGGLFVLPQAVTQLRGPAIRDAVFVQHQCLQRRSA